MSIKIEQKVNPHELYQYFMLLGIEMEFLQKKKIENLAIAKEIVKGYNWRDELGRNLEPEEERAIIYSILKNGELNKDKNGYLSVLISKLEKKGLSDQEICGTIINFAINGIASKSDTYTRAIKRGKTEELELVDTDKKVSKNSIIKAKSECLTKKQEKQLQEELIKWGLTKEFVEQKDIRNVYIAKEIVEGYNWEELFGRKIDSEEKMQIIHLILNKSCLNKGKVCLSALISKIKQKGISEQEIYAVIINLAINDIDYNQLLIGSKKVKDLEFQDVDKTVTEDTIVKMKIKRKNNKEGYNRQASRRILEEELIKELICLGVQEEFIEEKDIRNVYMAKTIVESYKWQDSLGRKLEPDEKSAIIKSILRPASLNKNRTYSLSRLMLKLEEKGLSDQAKYAVIMNLAINKHIRKGYSYTAIIQGQVDITNLELNNDDIRVSARTVKLAKNQAEKAMKKAIQQQRGKISKITTPEQLINGLGIRQEKTVLLQTEPEEQ